MPDNSGNLRKQEIHIPSQTMRYQEYDYDSLNRLKRVHEYTGNTALDWQQEFDYDRWGNRTINATGTWIGNQNNPQNPLLNEMQFDANILASTNRLQAPGDQALPENQKRMRYDAVGNLTNDTYTGAGNRTYDGENKITSAWGGNNQAQLYGYDPSGQRIKRTVNGVETWQVYGFGGELLAEYPANGELPNPQKEYGYRNGQLLLTAEAGSGGGAQNVNWTNAVGVSISNNNLTRTMAGDGWSTGAISSQMIASGDGYAEFTVTETNKRRSFGLTSNTSVTSFQYISYGMHIAEDGQITIHEGIGVYGVFGTYTTGDKLRVSIEGGMVKYRKNGTLLRTSTLAPTYPLYAGASIYSNAGTVTAAVITSGLHSAIWTNAVGVSISNNNLTRTMAGDGWSTGAISSQSIASGDGYAEFTVTETNKRRSFGLTSNTSVTAYQHISYGMHIAEDGQITIHEGIGVYGVFGTYTTGDKLRVSIEGGMVKYRKNGTLLRTSTLAPTYPLYAGASIYSNAGTVTAAVITSGLHSAIWTNAVGVSISNNNLTRTMAGDGWSTGAISSQSIASGDGYAEFTVTETNKRRSFGLTSNTSVTAYQHISYGMHIAEDGQITIHEGLGVYGVFGTYTAGDKLRVSIEGGVVKYRKNGTLLRTSTLPPTYPLYAGGSIYSNAGTVTNAVLTSGTIGSATNFRWLVTDHLGTPRMIFDQTGELANMTRHDYLPFGEEIFAPTGGRSTAMGYAGGDGVRQQFTAYERDVETGLDYSNARYFANTQGRFTSPDPMLSSGKPPEPQSWNRYAYVLNNPLVYVDPSGLIWGYQDGTNGNGERVRTFMWFDGDQVDEGWDPYYSSHYVARDEVLWLDSGSSESLRIARSNFSEEEYASLLGAQGLDCTAFSDQQRNIVNREIADQVGRGWRYGLMKGIAGMAGGLAGSFGSGLNFTFGATARQANRLPPVLFHYTDEASAGLIQSSQLGRPGGQLFMTNNGGLTPLQAQLELSLPQSNTARALFAVDTQTLSGLNLVRSGRVTGNVFSRPGGGFEFQFGSGTTVPQGSFTRFRF